VNEEELPKTNNDEAEGEEVAEEKAVAMGVEEVVGTAVAGDEADERGVAAW